MPTRDRSEAGSSVRISAKTYKQLKRIVDRADKTQTEIIKILIDMCEVNDLLRKDWQDRLNATLRRGMWQIQQEEHFSNRERCEGLRAADLKWKCISGRKDKTPMIRILAEDRIDALNLCEGCELTLAPRLQNEEYARQIKTLQDEIQIKSDRTFKVPICHKGATLNEDGTEFGGCPKTSAKTPVSIAKYCKVLSGGLPCMLYAERRINAESVTG